MSPVSCFFVICAILKCRMNVCKELAKLSVSMLSARGLDISHIKTVVNYDVARDIDTHTHRIGRTGKLRRVLELF